ncbi:helix-turn-helix domain-containing protein [Corynebacterium glucuronolyticum]|uniref:Helix-turn-helix domain-containing protein n=2 Tax=Corynebacterium glucuronolyticum TaxID=39791 RepID=A0AAX1L8D0_9CORY|nr:helix-turn-helix domain-containing protein [Corynebacterium glucuronolyticum]
MATTLDVGISPWLTVEQAANYINTSKDTIRRLIRRGLINSSHITPRTLRIERASLDDYLASRSTLNHRGR